MIVEIAALVFTKTPRDIVEPIETQPPHIGCIHFFRYKQVTCIAKANQPPVEQEIDMRGQEQTVIAI